ncbi:NAD(P)H-dependent oxidoreductase [Streptomyces sp. 891-h]|uniref:NADPH-dependent FMN reductase n=1 Tax=unclassified Streptomyces TaxID=2593676 RepID=UPI001FAAFC87|nr:NAD(P)H-dependent oxidoreductase [Streptomyces sp. 891-h]UNZ20466.1 NAD(P)H-dependent oxidoreductase [Streptomyces sp. 891-h]
MTRIGIVIGSTRPGRSGEAVGRWVHEIAARRDDAQYELIDLAQQELPPLDEAIPPMAGMYAQPHTLAWAERIARLDGFVFVTPEYNHSVPAALKNAVDYLFAEWGNKAAGFVGYGPLGATRAVEHLRLILSEVRMATVRTQVALTFATDFEDRTVFRPSPENTALVDELLDQVVLWSEALEPVRRKASA